MNARKQISISTYNHSSLPNREYGKKKSTSTPRIKKVTNNTQKKNSYPWPSNVKEDAEYTATNNFKKILNDSGNKRSTNIVPKQSNLANESMFKDATKRKTPRKVCFSPSVKKKKKRKQSSSNECPMDTSMMGYDWIAHMVDNESVLHDQSDDYFNQIEQFRKENWEQCKVVQDENSEIVRKEVETTSNLSEVANVDKDIEENLNRLPLCCTGNGAYTLNKRCDLIPIHGPYSSCPICKRKLKCEPENENSSVRVTIPKRALESPYRIRPHRRKSYDPSESVSLSSHCLAGWKGRKPRGTKTTNQGIGISSEVNLLNKEKCLNEKRKYK